jgi:hypothetical protein
MYMENVHAIMVPRFVAATLAKLHEVRLVAATLHREARAKASADLRKIASDAVLLGLMTVASLATKCEQCVMRGDDSTEPLGELERAIASI